MVGRDTIYKLKNVENYSTAEAQVYKEGENRIIVEISEQKDANKIQKNWETVLCILLNMKTLLQEKTILLNTETGEYEIFAKTIEEIEVTMVLFWTVNRYQGRKNGCADD